MVLSALNLSTDSPPLRMFFVLRLSFSAFALSDRPFGMGIKRANIHIISQKTKLRAYFQRFKCRCRNTDNVSTHYVANIYPHKTPVQQPAAPPEITRTPRFRSSPRAPPPASRSEKFVTKCPTPRYAPHIGKLPLAAALSPIL